jgi:signal peptidase I
MRLMKNLLWLRDIVVIVAFMVVLRWSIVNWYVIPTGSMLPTIKIKDHVLVNKLSYGLMLPFTEKHITMWNTPHRGDIVLFKSPQDDVTFVKRAIGLPGDTIAFQSGTLVVNGTPVDEKVTEERSVLADMGEPSEGKVLFNEQLPDGPNHYVMRLANGGQTLFESRQWKIPEGKLLVLGDNRDGSNDGRFWGYVDINRVYGKAMRIFYSIEPSEGLLPKFRTDRFFAELH